MRAYELISKKRDGKKLSREEIEFLIKGYVKKRIPDYQMSALLMASFIKGLDAKETFYLTESMLNSGVKYDLSHIKGIKVDKHSTGGVGDKVSIPLAPIVAACGVKVPMMSGRGLGHTGGTLDKLESIPGFSTNLSFSHFKRQLEKIGFAFIGQTERIVPADKRMYALRDVTATVESIPLITASIMSKKIAEGADAYVFDIKTGSGAFMNTLNKARALAIALKLVSKKFKKKAVCLITDMNQPLGFKIGNALEIEESIDILKGKGPEDLKKIVKIIAMNMVALSQKDSNYKKYKSVVEKAINSREALEKFKRCIEMQGGNPGVIDNLNKLPQAKYWYKVKSLKNGYISKLEARGIGIASLMLGAGRERKEDRIDYSAGIILKMKVGSKVKKGDTIAVFKYNDKKKLKSSIEIFNKSLQITRQKPSIPPLIKTKI